MSVFAHGQISLVLASWVKDFVGWPVMRIRRIGAIAVLVASCIFVLLVHCRCAQSNRGCVNQGKDERKFATIICCLQRHMSWNSRQEPHFVMIGRPDRANAGVAWPPYLVFNKPDKKSGWLMFRIGFRYDRNWHGYIFPTIAIKNTDKPLRY